jgi:hypothetical protein
MSMLTWAQTAFHYTRTSLCISYGDQRLAGEYQKRIEAGSEGTWEKKGGGWVYTRGTGKFSNSFAGTGHDYSLALAKKAEGIRAGEIEEHACVTYKFFYEAAQAGKTFGVASSIDLGSFQEAVQGARPGEFPPYPMVIMHLDSNWRDSLVVYPYAGIICTKGQLEEAAGNALDSMVGPDRVRHVQRKLAHANWTSRCRFNPVTKAVSEPSAEVRPTRSSGRARGPVRCAAVVPLEDMPFRRGGY